MTTAINVVKFDMSNAEDIEDAKLFIGGLVEDFLSKIFKHHIDYKEQYQDLKNLSEANKKLLISTFLNENSVCHFVDKYPFFDDRNKSSFKFLVDLKMNYLDGSKNKVTQNSYFIDQEKEYIEYRSDKKKLENKEAFDEFFSEFSSVSLDVSNKNIIEVVVKKIVSSHRTNQQAFFGLLYGLAVNWLKDHYDGRVEIKDQEFLDMLTMISMVEAYFPYV